MTSSLNPCPIPSAYPLLPLIERYYTPGGEAHRILLCHSWEVRTLALELAERHPRRGEIDLGFLDEGAMLHDIGVFLTHAPKIDCHGTEPYIRHGYLGAELLRSLGMPRHARIAERHTGSGLTMEMIREQGLDLPPGIYYPETLEEKIICYADGFYSKTKLGQRKTYEEVRGAISRYGEEALWRLEELHREVELGL